MAAAVAGRFARMGLGAAVRTFEWATDPIYVHAADPMDLIGWGNTTWDADRATYPCLHAAELFANEVNPGKGRLLDEARVSMNPRRRRELYAQVARLALEDVPILPPGAAGGPVRRRPPPAVGGPAR